MEWRRETSEGQERDEKEREEGRERRGKFIKGKLLSGGIVSIIQQLPGTAGSTGRERTRLGIG